MLILSIDTSTNQSSVALTTETQTYQEASWFAIGNQSVELFQALERLLKNADISLAEIEAFAVAMGPGSFNGVRVALSVARTFALTQHKPLLGISTLDIIAAEQRYWQGPLCAVLDAGKGQFYSAWYRNHLPEQESIRTLPQRLSEYQLASVEALDQQVQALDWSSGSEWPILYAGEIRDGSAELLLTQFGKRAILARGSVATRHASTLAFLAHQRLLAGESDDPYQLEPLYLRRPSITQSTRKKVLLGGTRTHESQEKEGEKGALHP